MRLKGKLLQMHIQGQLQQKLHPRLFSANSSLRVFSKSLQYYFNTKIWFALTEAVSKSGPKFTSVMSG